MGGLVGEQGAATRWQDFHKQLLSGCCQTVLCRVVLCLMASKEQHEPPLCCAAIGKPTNLHSTSWPASAPQLPLRRHRCRQLRVSDWHWPAERPRVQAGNQARYVCLPKKLKALRRVPALGGRLASTPPFFSICAHDQTDTSAQADIRFEAGTCDSSSELKELVCFKKQSKVYELKNRSCLSLVVLSAEFPVGHMA